MSLRFGIADPEIKKNSYHVPKASPVYATDPAASTYDICVVNTPFPPIPAKVSVFCKPPTAVPIRQTHSKYMHERHVGVGIWNKFFSPQFHPHAQALQDEKNEKKECQKKKRTRKPSEVLLEVSEPVFRFSLLSANVSACPSETAVAAGGSSFALRVSPAEV